MTYVTRRDEQKARDVSRRSNMATGYSFPTADLPEIVSVVRDWGLQDVHQSQIAACDPQIIQTIYSVALERVTGISPTALDQAVERSTVTLQENSVCISHGTCSRIY